MTLNFTKELAQLMRFVGDTATAIRMYSAYSGGSPSTYLHRDENPQRDLVELMFLADALHHFTTLGRVLEIAEPDEVMCVCDEILRNFADYSIDKPDFGSRQAKPVFEAWKGLVQLDEARSAIAAIRTKASVKMTSAA